MEEPERRSKDRTELCLERSPTTPQLEFSRLVLLNRSVKWTTFKPLKEFSKKMISYAICLFFLWRVLSLISGWPGKFFVRLWCYKERRKCIQSCTTKDCLLYTNNSTAKFLYSCRPRTCACKRSKHSVFQFCSSRTQPGIDFPFTTCFDKCVRRKQNGSGR